MRVAFYLPHLADGGVVRSSFLLAREFAQHGHEVDVLTIRPSGSMAQRPPSGVRLIDLGARRALTSVPALARYLRQTRPDALISAQHFANVTAVLARTLARSRAKLILTERVAIDEALKRDRGSRRLVMPRLIRWLYGRADEVVANSADNAERLDSFLGWRAGRTKYIYNPTADPDIHTLKAEEVAEPWFEEDGPPVVISVGRLEHQKDFGTLIRAFARVRREVPARLVILGEGPDRDALESLIQSLGLEADVELPGFRSNPYSYVARSALFVLSSRYEGLPNALIEAQVCGVPSISTDCPTGPREILKDGEVGVLVPVGDADEMAKQIKRLLTDRDQANAFAEKATAALGRFAPEASYEAYLALIVSDRGGQC